MHAELHDANVSWSEQNAKLDTLKNCVSVCSLARLVNCRQTGSALLSLSYFTCSLASLWLSKTVYKETCRSHIPIIKLQSERNSPAAWRARSWHRRRRHA